METHTYRGKEYPRKMLPTLPRFEPENMDHSAVKVFKECPRKYFYRMVLGRTLPAGKWTSVFAWGTAIHKYLEVLYQTDGDAGAAAMAALPLWKPPSYTTFDWQTKERLTENFVALYKMYVEEKKLGNIKVLAIEQPFNIMFEGGIPIGGRWDQLIQWNGRVWLRDWKTSSKQLQYFKSGLEPNDQAIRYIYATSCLQFGQDENYYPNKVIDGALFVHIYNTKTVKPTYQSVPVSRTLNQIKTWVDEQKFIHKQMEICREEDTWPMHEVSCSFCDYRMVCNAPSNGSIEHQLKQQYVLSPWKHEEVDQKIEKE